MMETATIEQIAKGHVEQCRAELGHEFQEQQEASAKHLADATRRARDEIHEH